MIKVISAAIKHPTNRSIDDFFRYWRERHGPLFARKLELRRYVQHFSITEAYRAKAHPTHDRASMFWSDDLDTLRVPQQSARLNEVISPADRDLYSWYVA